MLFLSPHLLGWPAVRERSFLVPWLQRCLSCVFDLARCCHLQAQQVGTNRATCRLGGQGLNIIHNLFEQPVLDCVDFLAAPKAQRSSSNMYMFLCFFFDRQVLTQSVSE